MSCRLPQTLNPKTLLMSCRLPQGLRTLVRLYVVLVIPIFFGEPCCLLEGESKAQLVIVACLQDQYPKEIGC